MLLLANVMIVIVLQMLFLHPRDPRIVIIPYPPQYVVPARPFPHSIARQREYPICTLRQNTAVHLWPGRDIRRMPLIGEEGQSGRLEVGVAQCASDGKRAGDSFDATA